jgi:Ni,Fe-hydrogenase III component G
MPSWHTKEWKHIREALLGDRCEQCGATKQERRLVLQHDWHPPSFDQVRREAAYKLHLSEDHPFVWAEAKAMHEENRQRYMSGADTRTFCDKCAYLWDEHDMRLCSYCGRHYHKFSERMCKHCIEERSNASCGDLFDSLQVAY